MATPHQVGQLQITEDLAFQEKEWTVQRAVWVVMVLIVLLALAGLFSTGPLSSASVESADGALEAGYQRFVRHDGRSTLTFEVDGSHATNNEIELWLSQHYLDGVQVQGISPQPTAVRGADDRLIYVFVIDDPSSTLQVSFSLRPQEIGRLAGEAGVTDGPTVTFNQISYP